MKSSSLQSSSFKLLSRQLRLRRAQVSCARRAFTASHARPAAEPPQRDSYGNGVDFGYQTVAESLKAAKVGAVFSSVASSYDAMNDFMSLGVHRLWKDQFVRGLNPGLRATDEDVSLPSPGWKILDVAGGTGDIAFRMLDHAATINGDTTTQVTISDINPDMLEEGKKRSLNTQYRGSDRLKFVEANAEKLDMIESDSLDLYTVAFGIRNFTDKSAALREAYRVLKPGGVFACLEFSKVQNQLFDAVYKRWSFGAIPLIGQLVAADRDSYQYLVESIDKFPSQEQFRAMIREAGFITLGQGYENLTNGIAAIHKGVKPLPQHRVAQETT